MYYVVLGSQPYDLKLGIFTSLYKARKFAQDLIVNCAIFNSNNNEVSLYPNHRS